MCFFVLCKRHWFNRVPGAHQGDSLYIPFTLTLTLAMPSYLLTSLGASGNIGERGLGVTSYGRGLDSTALAPLPAQDHMYPFGIIEVAAWYSLTGPLCKVER